MTNPSESGVSGRSFETEDGIVRDRPMTPTANIPDRDQGLREAVERLTELADGNYPILVYGVETVDPQTGESESVFDALSQSRDLRTVLAALASQDMGLRDLASSAPALDGHCQAETETWRPLFKRACELVVHDLDCPARRSGRDEDCSCDAVPFLNDFEASIARAESRA